MHLSGIKRCKKTHQCLECFHRGNLDRPISQWEALLLQSICAFKEPSPYSHAYRVLFPKTVKIHLHCTAGHPVSVCAHSQPVSTVAIYTDTCIISEGNGWLFSQVARCWKEEHAACPSPSMVPAATLHDGTSPLLRQAPLRRSCCICIGVNMLDPTPWRVIQSLICKRILWQARGIQLHITKSQTIDWLPARHWGWSEEDRFS